MLADLLELVYDRPELAELDPAARRLALRDLLVHAGVDDVPTAVARVADEIDGYGPITPLMRDDITTDILINGHGDVWVEEQGELHPAACHFDSPEHLRAWCERRVSVAGGRLDDSAPISDVRLEDGSRMHVVLPPLAPDGPLVSIRRFPSRPLTLLDLVERGSMTSRESALLEAAVAESRSIVVSGATGSGKTTLLNALLLIVPDNERVVVIEELPELKLPATNTVSLVARGANAEGRGEVTLERLVRASLRMRPDRIVVGEVRGSEALPALWAMSTGHRGSMLSVHAASAVDARQRLVDLALMAARAPQETTLAREVERTVDIHVHLVRRDGGRVVDQILIT